MKYQITIGEPWDFKGPDGESIIIGEVIKEITPTCLIFRSDQPQRFGDQTGNYFLLSSRYRNEILSSDNSFSGIVNGGLLFADFEHKSKIELEASSKFVFIGNLRKWID